MAQVTDFAQNNGCLQPCTTSAASFVQGSLAGVCRSGCAASELAPRANVTPSLLCFLASWRSEKAFFLMRFLMMRSDGFLVC